MTKVEIIKETVEYYSTHPRSINPYGDKLCLYRGPNGAMCAFARVLRPEILAEINEEQNASTIIEEYNDENGHSDIFLEEYADHSDISDCRFWDDVQKLHDNPTYWNDKIFTEFGKNYMNILLEAYK